MMTHPVRMSTKWDALPVWGCCSGGHLSSSGLYICLNGALCLLPGRAERECVAAMGAVPRRVAAPNHQLHDSLVCTRCYQT